MTDRLWNYLETELDTTESYLELETEYGTFCLEPIFNSDESEVIDFLVSHGSYMTNVREEPDIWYWEEIENHLFK
jgi:hypothetical protein